MDRLLGRSVGRGWVGRLPLDGRGLLRHGRCRLLLDRGYNPIATAGRVLRRTSATAAAKAATAKVVRLGLRFRAEKKGESDNYYQRCGHYQRELAAQRDSQSAAAASFVDKGVVVCTQPYADPLPTNPEVPYGTSKTIRVNMIPSQLASVT